MKPRNHIVLCLFALVAVAGCASTKVTERQQLVTGQIARPNNIWVYDFVATPADVPADSEVTPHRVASVTTRSWATVNL
jgi:hypothetical protein